MGVIGREGGERGVDEGEGLGEMGFGEGGGGAPVCWGGHFWGMDGWRIGDGN